MDLTSLASSLRPRLSSLYPHVFNGWVSHLQQSLPRNIFHTPLEILVFSTGSIDFGLPLRPKAKPSGNSHCARDRRWKAGRHEMCWGDGVMGCQAQKTWFRMGPPKQSHKDQSIFCDWCSFSATKISGVHIRLIDGRNQFNMFNTLTIWPIAKVIHLLYTYGIILGFSTVTPISVDWCGNRYCIDQPQRPRPLMAYVTIGRPTPLHRPCLGSKW